MRLKSAICNTLRCCGCKSQDHADDARRELDDELNGIRETLLINCLSHLHLNNFVMDELWLWMEIRSVTGTMYNNRLFFNATSVYLAR